MFKNADEVLSGLDPEQKIAAQKTKGAVAIVAGAGTGKTRTITHRIAYGVLNDGWHPPCVMAVTFTAKAAKEMRERLELLGIKGCQVGTFHALALKQMMHFWPRVTGTKPPLLETQKTVHILDAAEKLGFSIPKFVADQISDEIGWAKVSLVSPKDYPQTARLMDREILETFPSLCELSSETVIARIYEEYDSLKSERGMVDFEDILLLMIHLISTRDQVAKEIREEIEQIIVDEYQDVSPLQQELLNAWLGDKNEICVVGDPSQTIYSFAGATESYLMSFEEFRKNANRVELVRDYRSSPQIVSLANTILKKRGKMGFAPLKLVSQLPNKGIEVEWKETETDAAQADFVAKSIKNLIEKKIYLPSQIAILSRTNSGLDDFAAALRANSVKFYLKKPPSSVAEDDEVDLPLSAPEGVSLVSLHASKGLEWDCVFLVNLSDGQMPINRAKTDEAIEEERRLLYVGVTRAKEKLTMCFARAKTEGARNFRNRSRFLDGIWPAK